MKLYDFDGMFDEKLSEYIKKNTGKYKEEEWEDIIPVMYQKFGDTTIKSLGKTPREYYGEMTDDELITCLKEHLKYDVPVSDFLCKAIEGRNMTEKLLPLLDGTDDEMEYTMILLGSDPAALDKYMEILRTTDSDFMKGRCVDFIKEKADIVLKQAKENYKKGIDMPYMLEIMSCTTVRDEEVFEILLKEFRTDPQHVALHASYLAAYGDERALPYLLDKIDEDGISFIEYRELKLAIEAFGGEYNKEKDFSGDPYYKWFKPD